MSGIGTLHGIKKADETTRRPATLEVDGTLKALLFCKVAWIGIIDNYNDH